MKNTDNRILKGLSLILVIFMIIFLIGSESLFRNVYSLDEDVDPQAEIPISDADTLADYARAYQRGYKNSNDTLNLAMLGSSSDWILPDNFVGIGTAGRPFNGKIIIGQGQSNKFYLNKALFNYITTDALVVDASDHTREITLIRTESNSKAIFADHVVKGTTTNDAEWIVSIQIHDPNNDENRAVYDTGSLIGDIADEANVTVSFTNDAYDSRISISKKNGDIISDGNTGAICGTLGSDATLTVSSMSGTNAICLIKSNTEHAGGIVGEMGDGATLVLPENFTSLYDVTASKYAGSIVGYAVNATVSAENDSVITLTKTTTGSYGAGGVYGYYQNTDAAREIDLENIASDSNYILKGNGSAGGVIGYLASTTSITITNSACDLTDNNYALDVHFQGGLYRGGIIGQYNSSSLTNTLTVNDVEVAISQNSSLSGSARVGGIIGTFTDANPAYVKFDGINVSVIGDDRIYGGVLGSMGTSGSFVDFVNTTTVKGNVRSGLIESQNIGVIRLTGTTDLSAAKYSEAQLVRYRSEGLIYALGSGVGNGWIFKRGTGNVDDVKDWGEVLRISEDYNGLKESDFFTVNMTNHTITVCSHVASMGTVKDFIKTALNMQLNNGGTNASLIFDAGSVTSVLLSANLSITADINLEKTGITGFTKDKTDVKFKGTLNGNSHKISLAVGEPYGYVGSSPKTSADIGDNNYGTIFSHQEIGLFAGTDGASISNLEIGGFISVSASSGSFEVSGLIASAIGNSSILTLDKVTTSQTIYLYSKGASIRCGGAVATIGSTSTGTVAISNCDFKTTILDKRTQGTETNIGGAIGFVSSTNNLTLNFNTINLYGVYNNTVSGSSNFARCYYGGLIGSIINNSGVANRNINLININVKKEVEITTKVSSDNDRSIGSGTFIGSRWYDTVVTIGSDGGTNGITIGESGTSNKPLITIPTGSSNVNVSALFYKSTGYMRVNHVNVVNMKIDNKVTASSFGFIVNDAFVSLDLENGILKDGLYLEVVSDKFSITNANISGTYTIYDEICAFSKDPEKDIDENGHAVISIQTASGAALSMTGTSTNTYQNQNAAGNGKINPNTRYYYNLDLIRAKETKTNPDKLMLWSVNTYALDNIKDYFEGGFDSTFSGSLDMNGYSYYPVDASDITIASGTSIKFYNNEIETGENGSGNTDSLVRSTRPANQSQHYLMHEGLFRNYTGNLTVNGLTVSGNVSNASGGSGFLVCKMLGNTNTSSTITLNNIVLNNAEVIGSDTKPLLINAIGQNTNFTLTGVTTTGYPSPTVAVATSLIGDVGYDTAKNISLTFSDIRLDARTSALSALDGKYGTSRSIFSRATLLNSFRFINGGSAKYNFTHDEDWTSSQHHVTYGKEISESEEYEDLQKMYYNDTTYFVSPVSSSSTDPENTYDFSTGFLPYVYVAYEESTTKHEIRINISDSATIEGCGKYNDPYQIKSGDMLNAIYLIIYGVPSTEAEIVLPDDTTNYWCDSTSSNITERSYKYTGSNFQAQDSSGKTKTLAVVREYLAGAYYSIDEEITIRSSHDFNGLGYLNSWTDTTNPYLCPYAFRGVIVGNNHTITIEKAVPLVSKANGCVIKDLTVKVSATLSVSQTSTAVFDYKNTVQSFGAVIGQVMAGDNILDAVGVDLTNLNFNLGSSTFRRLVPIGGFIGVIVSGGVIFRNVDSVASNYKTGITSSKLSAINHVVKTNYSMSTGYGSDNGNNYLYINPIIGRVIGGYAFAEKANTYAYDEANTVIKNGTKNYSIPTIDPNDTTSLTVSSTGESAHVVNVNNGQALYLLSCIVNSGAGSATYNASSIQGYNDVSKTPWVAYRKYAYSRCGTYDEVGKSALSTGDYAVVSAMDKYDNTTKVPYIIYHYTDKTGNVYHARSIAKKDPSVSVINFTNTTYELPQGYRGIGLIYYDSAYLRLGFNKINGNNAVINLRMIYNEYDATTNGDNYKAVNNSGFGLFNMMYHASASSTNVIKDLTISGSIDYDIFTRDKGNQSLYAFGDKYGNSPYDTMHVAISKDQRLDNGNNATSMTATFLNVGGLAGSLGAATYIQNVKLKDLLTNGATYTGGLIGLSINKNVTIMNPSAINLSVNSGFAAGGLIGGFKSSGNLTIKGTSDNIATIRINNINIKGIPSSAKIYNTDYNSLYNCAGGLCGYLNTGTSKTITVQYVDIVNDTASTGTFTATRRDYRPDDMRYKVLVGGAFGYITDSLCSVSDINIENINYEGNVSGGLIGMAYKSVNGSFSNINIEATNKIIDGSNNAGGVIGVFFQNASSVNLSFSSITVKGYDISQSHAGAERSSAGGLLGALFFQNFTSTSYLTFNDIIVEDCDISKLDIKTTGPNWKGESLESCGVGGVIGALISKITDSSGQFTGHNILLNNVNVSSTDDRTEPGSIIGTNLSGKSNGSEQCYSTTIKIVGISFYGGTSRTNSVVGEYNPGKPFGTDNGYVIFADYTNKAVTDANESSAFLYNSSTDYAATMPFVTTNPGSLIAANEILTGDGMASTVESSPIKSILDDGLNANGTVKNPVPLYDYSKAYLTVFNGYKAKLSTFNTEQSTELPYDFVVLAVDDMIKANTTTMINAYINLLANTNYNYGIDVANVYSVDIYRMVYNENTKLFENDTTNLACLRRDNEQFYMTSGEADTAGIMFSLIDVKYYDPANTSKVAYHLYIPVLVRKMVRFDFKIATGVGTNYESNWYTTMNRWGENLMENLGTPTTILFEFDYLRSNTEWENAINNGENIYRNYNKRLTFVKPAGLTDLPGNTVLTLVDPQNNGKVYYSTISAALSDGMLNLSAFKTVITKSGDNYVLSGDTFEPVKFSDILSLSLTSGGHLVAQAGQDSETTLYYNGTYYKYDGSQAGMQVTVNGTFEKLMERYYISFFTDSSSSNILYHYTIGAPLNFNDPSNPSRMNNQGAKANAIHLILGNIFEQASSDVKITSRTDNEEITLGNNVIKADMETVVKIVDAMKDQVSTFLKSDSLNVYQSFLLYLNRSEGSGSQRLITGNPTPDGGYYITSVNGSVAAIGSSSNLCSYLDSSYGDININNNYSEFVCNKELDNYLLTGDGAHIISSVSLVYNSEESISEQFPNRTNIENRTIGVTLSASSNVAYDPSLTSISKSSVQKSDLTKVYYSSISGDSARLYLNVVNNEFDGDYGSLGINPHDTKGATRLNISTEATLDITSIIDDTMDGQNYAYDVIKVVVTLRCKDANGKYEGSDLTLSDYFSQVSTTLSTPSGYTNSLTGTTYTFYVSRSDAKHDIETSLNIPLNFVVLTGSEFEDKGNKYSNYRIEVSCSLVKTENGNIISLSKSNASDFVVYTNARILPDFAE